MNNNDLISFCKLNKISIKEILDIDKLEKEIQSTFLNNKPLTKGTATLIDENKLLKEKNHQLENQIKEMASKIMFLELLINKTTELENDDTSFNNLCKELRKNYECLDEFVKRDLKQKFKIINLESLILNSVLYLEELWDYTLMYRERSFITFEIIRNIIYLLFDFQKEVFNIEWQEVEIGDKFDETKFLMNDESENKIGIIEEVLLKGYIEDEEIIKKSLVKVK